MDHPTVVPVQVADGLWQQVMWGVLFALLIWSALVVIVLLALGSTLVGE